MCSVFKKCFSSSNTVEPEPENAVSARSYTRTRNSFVPVAPLPVTDSDLIVKPNQPDLIPSASTMPQMHIIVFLSSIRPHRFADRVLTLVKNIIEARGMKVTVFDPLEMEFGMIQTPLHFYPNPDDAPAWLREANQMIVDADGFVVISAEYNCSIPPPLSNMLDHFSPASFRHRPCGLVGYSMGQFGGIRALTLLRAYVAEFGMLPLPQNVPIPTVQDTLEDDGKDKEGRVTKNVEKLAAELEWYADAIANHKKVAPPSEHTF